MLMLQLYVGDSCFALDSSWVVEVVPRVVLKPVPKAPDYIAGQMNYRGKPTSVTDFCLLLTGKPATTRLHSRIIICQYEDEKGKLHPMGLVAERVTSTLRAEAEVFEAVSLAPDSLNFLGGVLPDDQGGVQFIDFHALLRHIQGELKATEEAP